MKKKLIYISLSLCLITFISLSYFIVSRYLEENRHNAKIPSFSFFTLEGESFDNSNLKTNEQTLIIYASSECEYCTEDMKLLVGNKEDFKSIQIVMVFPFEAFEVEGFLREVEGLQEFPKIHFLLDPLHKFPELFGLSKFPSFFIYNKDQQLVKKIQGISNANDITRFIDI